MNRLIKTALLSATLLMGTSLAFADCKPKPVKRCVPKPPECPCPPKAAKPPMAPSYSAPARITTRCEWDKALWASFIYWQPRFESFSLAGIDTSGDGIPDDFIEMDYDWKPGFKVGASTELNRDDWNGFAQYTWMHMSNRVSVTPEFANIRLQPNDYFYPNSSSQVSSLKSRWQMSANWMDLGLSRAYYSGTELTFTPFFGPKVAWITHRVNSQYIDESLPDTPIYSKARVKSWKVGPRVGFLGNWHLGEGVRFTGDAAFSILYSRYKVKFDGVVNEQGDVKTLATTRKSLSQLIPWAELSWGLGWGSYFNQDRWHMDLSAAYELHVVFDETIFDQLFPNLLGANKKSSDLYFHGLTLNAKVDF